MKTAIVGAGAMGSLFGALLTEAGADVCLLDVWAEHVEKMNRDGLSLEKEGRVRQVRVKASTDLESIQTADLVIIFVKSTQTESAVAAAARLAGSSGLVLTLQNGMGNADIISETVDPRRVMAGTTSHGATMLGPGRIRHAGAGPTVVGMWSGGDLARARATAEFLTAGGIVAEAVGDVRSVLWGKLLINVGINAITALTGIKNGQILDLEATVRLSRAAVTEAMTVARALGVTVREDAVDHVLEVARATGGNRSSMGQDVDHKRRTEIKAINGAVVRTARQLGLEAPVNETLSCLVETLEGHYQTESR